MDNKIRRGENVALIMILIEKGNEGRNFTYEEMIAELCVLRQVSRRTAREYIDTLLVGKRLKMIGDEKFIVYGEKKSG